MNFLFSLESWEGMECHTILMRGTSTAGACLEKSLSYDSRIAFCFARTFLASPSFIKAKWQLASLLQNNIDVVALQIYS